MQPDGTVLPAGGVIGAFVPPSGPGIRVDTFAYAGYETSARYDSAAGQGHRPRGEPAPVRSTARRVLSVNWWSTASTPTPVSSLPLLERPEVRTGQVTTRFVEQNLAELLQVRSGRRQRRADPGTGGS